MYKGRKGFYLGERHGGNMRTRKPGNTPVRKPMADRRSIGPILRFLGSRGVGKVKDGVIFSTGAP